MLKKLIKKICHKIVEIGNFEIQRIAAVEKKQMLDRIAEISSDALITDDATVYNKSRPRDKIKIGERSRLMGQLFLFDQEGEIVIGRDCFIGPDTRIWSAKKISIGDRVLIAHNVNIHDNISHPLDAQIRYRENCDFVKTGVHNPVDIKGTAITIEDDVWIGFNATILRGVRIGRGAIIGAGSLVTKDVEAWTVNVGNPLRCLQKLTPQDF